MLLAHRVRYVPSVVFAPESTGRSVLSGPISRAFTVDGRTILVGERLPPFTLSPFGETTSTGSSGACTP